MSKYICVLICVSFLALYGILNVCSSIGADARPEDIVRSYCQFDFNGVRLSGDRREAIDCLVIPSLSSEYEPGWDSAVIVSGYKISLVSQKATSAEVRVKYEVIGLRAADSWFPASTKDEKIALDVYKYSIVIFYLMQENGIWEISKYSLPLYYDPEWGPGYDAPFYPHVSLEAEIESFKDKPYSTPEFERTKAQLRALQDKTRYRENKDKDESKDRRPKSGQEK